MRSVTEAGKDAVRQSRNRCIGRRASIAKSQRYRDYANDRRDNRKSPDGAPRSERLGMENAEVLRCFIVFAHGVSNTSASVHAAQSRSDQSQKHSEGLCQHKVLSAAVAEQPVTDNNHHVADRGCGRCRVLHSISGVKKVVCSEILDQITYKPLN